MQAGSGMWLAVGCVRAGDTAAEVVPRVVNPWRVQGGIGTWVQVTIRGIGRPIVPLQTLHHITRGGSGADTREKGHAPTYARLYL